MTLPSALIAVAQLEEVPMPSGKLNAKMRGVSRCTPSNPGLHVHVGPSSSLVQRPP